ncbi:nuclear transport factor 2 family protein [Streptomyces sp. NBS 14/10]|uniref:nuclear transport factor 2 family protein n=1 Tax=Streptomyces sp. NBS 14/10 TaxID=1945643 RepID=UPI000B7E240A|nr:nuclear transport factor 2 family protein [Streptomyces sp. NBS 14/10]KAK1178824.1 nuclear transport factor 2 family protein [Streptomyces sp. NBS 14/10]NUP40956.1 nuclear transport factor 2 family protein [Streptomyces sp.]NUS84222.1 nuclear transport factor 2 family protein [Streptomyces sp.]
MPETTAAALHDIVERFHRAMLNKSADDLADLYAVDARHEFPFLFPGLPTCFNGREEIRAGYRAMWGATPVEPEAIRDVAIHETAEAGTVVVEQTVVGALAPAGRPVTVPGILVIRVRDGLIVHTRDYMDGLGVAAATDRLPDLVAALGG